MKLICLVDNAVLSHSPFWGEHGLAFLVESAEGRALFDTGASGTVPVSYTHLTLPTIYSV